MLSELRQDLFHFYTVLQCHQHRQDKESSRCQNKDGSSSVKNSHTKDLTGTDQLTDDTDAGKPNGKSSPMPIPSNRELTRYHSWMHKPLHVPG